MSKREKPCEMCQERVWVDWTPAGRKLCQPCLDKFWDRREQTNRDYPDSDVAPSWVDPTYAGERWGDDY